MLMSPVITGYVRGVTDRTLDLVKASPALFELTPAMIKQPKAWKIIKDLTGPELTSIRSGMKQKVSLFLLELY